MKCWVNLHVVPSMGQFDRKFVFNSQWNTVWTGSSWKNKSDFLFMLEKCNLNISIWVDGCVWRYLLSAMTIISFVNICWHTELGYSSRFLLISFLTSQKLKNTPYDLVESVWHRLLKSPASNKGLILQRVFHKYTGNRLIQYLLRKYSVNCKVCDTLEKS